MKLMICLCEELTGGWASTRTLLVTSRPLCLHPPSPVLAPGRPLPLLTHMVAAQPYRACLSLSRCPPPASKILGTKSGAPSCCHSLTPLCLGPHLGSHSGLLGNLAGPGTARSVEGKSSPNHFQGGPLFVQSPMFTTFLDSWVEEVSRAVWPIEDLAAMQCAQY